MSVSGHRRRGRAKGSGEWRGVRGEGEMTKIEIRMAKEGRRTKVR